jgi:hypothetical protein
MARSGGDSHGGALLKARGGGDSGRCGVAAVGGSSGG